MRGEGSSPIVLMPATHNRGKLQEFMLLGRECVVEVIAPPEIAGAPMPNAAESGSSYLANVGEKLDGVWRWARDHRAMLPPGEVWIFADDTGLEVEALGGGPGVFSARYAGESATAVQNIAKLLGAMGETHDRSARFYSILAARELTSGREAIAEGELRGDIARVTMEGGGFGYDSIFIPEGHVESLARIKERIADFRTHRSRAFSQLLGAIRHTRVRG